MEYYNNKENELYERNEWLLNNEDNEDDRTWEQTWKDTIENNYYFELEDFIREQFTIEYKMDDKILDEFYTFKSWKEN